MTTTIRPSKGLYRRDDLRISLALVTPFVVLAMQYLVLAKLDLLNDHSDGLIKICSKTIVAVVYIIGFRIVWKRSKAMLILVYLLSGCIFVLNMLVFTENQTYLMNLFFPFFVISLPTFFYAYSINDWSIFDKNVEKVSMIVFVVGLIIALSAINGALYIGNYSMSLSYYMLLPALVYLGKLFNKITIESCIITIFSLLTIVLLGSRGALMCTAVFVVVGMRRMNKYRSYKSVIVFLLWVFSLILVLAFRKNIFTYLNDYFLSIGINSRTLALLMSNQLHLSGRDVLYQKMIYQIQNKPFLGVGIAGDRRILGGYAHNIFIEIFSGFGLVFGSLVIVSLITMVIKAFVSCDERKFNTLFLWFVMGVVPLVVSGSYLTSINFWIFMGLVTKKVARSGFSRMS